MNSITKEMEQMHILNDMGAGLLNQLYFVKVQLIANEQYALVSDAVLGKVRLKLEKKFPAHPDLAKLTGGEVFVQKADEIINKFGGFHRIMSDVADFSSTAKELLIDFTVKIVDFKLRKNRNMLVLFFDLLTTYMRVLYMVDSIEPRVAISAFYTTAAFLKGITGGTQLSAESQKIKAVFDACQDLHRHFIDSFVASQVFIMPMLLQLKESLLFVGNSDDLRKNNVLNPISLGVNMGAYSKKPISLANASVSAYTEMPCAVEQYVDYVSFALLACPGLFFSDPASLELLSVVTKHRLVISIFRDMSLNIHVEFEKVCNVFPAPADAITVPKGFKLKSALKGISRASVSTAGLNMRARRSVVNAELSALIHLIRATPGLVGPKCPALLAAAGMARAELLSFFRHADSLGIQDASYVGGETAASSGAPVSVTATRASIAVRKDTRAYFIAEHFADARIGELVQTLETAGNLFLSHHQIVNAYFKEFITGPDLKALVPMFNECGAAIDVFKNFFDSFVADLEQVRDGSAADSLTAGGDDDSTVVKGGEVTSPMHLTNLLLTDSQLDGFRLNWDRVVALASSQQMGSYIKNSPCAPMFDRLMERMSAVCSRSLCVDRCQWLYRSHFSLHNVAWFRESLMNAFTMTYKNSYSSAQHAFAFFSPFYRVEWSLHSDCPEEKSPIVTQTLMICQTMLSELTTFLMTLLRHLWEHYTALEMQYSPVEAIKRVERAVQLKKDTSDNSDQHEALPGCESEQWAAGSISKLVLLRNHVASLVHAAAAVGILNISTKSYNVVAYIHSHILEVFREKMHNIFGNVKGSAMSRPSIAVNKLMAGCRAMQYVVSFIGNSAKGVNAAFTFSSIVRDVFFQECGNAMLSIPPPGTATPIGAPLPSVNIKSGVTTAATGGGGGGGKQQSLIFKISSWITELIRNFCLPGSGVIWSPTLRTFINAHNRNLLKGSDHKHATTAVELFLDLEELKSIASLVGAQGVRAIESHLLVVVETQLKELSKLVYANRVQLSEFAQSHCVGSIQTLEAPVIGSTILESAMEALTQIGVVLHVRDLLHSALAHVIRVRADDLRTSTATALGAVDTWAALGQLQPLHCLAAASGVYPFSSCGSLNGGGVQDLALVASLSSIDLTSMQQQALYTHFPALSAAINLSQKWSHSVYLPQVAAFDGNEHCIQYAISKLSFFLFAQNQLEGWRNRASQLQHNHQEGGEGDRSSKGSTHGGTSTRGGGSVVSASEVTSSEQKTNRSSSSVAGSDEMDDDDDDNDTDGKPNVVSEAGSSSSSSASSSNTIQSPQFKPQTLTGSQMRAKYKEYVSTYIQMAAHTILLVSRRCSDSYQESSVNPVLDNIPYRSMAAQLVYFIQITPDATMDMLESYFPHGAIQSGTIDVALGKQCAADVLRAFPAFGDVIIDNASERD